MPIVVGMHENPHHDVGLEEQWQLLVPAEVVAGLPPILNSRQARIWSLVLDSRGVPCCLEQQGGGFVLLVPVFHLPRAYQELQQFEATNRGWPPPMLPQRPTAWNLLATLSVLILLATFHNIAQLDATSTGIALPDWVAQGGARSDRILAGEWWRAITALTLHADWAHLSSNLVIGGVFIVLLCRELGSGLAWSLLVGAGTLGNLMNAALQPASHNSVGASTAVFGVVGILAALSSVRHRHDLRRRWILPTASAVSLLALLGTEGKNTDLGAHLFGFVYGGFLGVIAEYLLGRYGRPGPWLNILLAVAACAAATGAWMLALSS